MGICPCEQQYGAKELHVPGSGAINTAPTVQRKVHPPKEPTKQIVYIYLIDYRTVHSMQLMSQLHKRQSFRLPLARIQICWCCFMCALPQCPCYHLIGVKYCFAKCGNMLLLWENLQNLHRTGHSRAMQSDLVIPTNEEDG
eukprot:gb/GECG01005127.1/.p1 GENE.gb/GECG01005127.1/~~gb/GECG01005127.1/.p1  ORF type:complete len:141 (+),score=2.09 gb/GECG01005127.1/:1-423(+)